jgi:hypothetical protein
MTDEEYKEKISRTDKFFSALTDKTGSATRIEIVFHVIMTFGSDVDIQSLSLIMDRTRQQLFPHLRRLYEAELITNPTRKKSIAPTKKLLDVAEGLQITFERI